jgi:hypothetical protein
MLYISTGKYSILFQDVCEEVAFLLRVLIKFRKEVLLFANQIEECQRQVLIKRIRYV